MCRKNIRYISFSSIPVCLSSHGANHRSRGGIVRFGGYDTTKGLVDDTWEFDGTIWHKMTSLITTPPGRTNHAMAYDSVRKSVVLFSGVAAARLSAAADEPLQAGWIVMAGGATAAEALSPGDYVRNSVQHLGTVAFSVTP